MKTNQLMQVSFKFGTLPIGHKDMFGDLRALFDIGNKYRAVEGKSTLYMREWLKRNDVRDYIDFLENELGHPALRTKKGKGGGTWAHLYVLIDAATSLSPAFKHEVYTKFIEGNLLEWRDRSGDNFIDLNAAIALNAEKVFGKPAHSGHYITLAKIIRRRILGEDADTPTAWNFAEPHQLHERARIEEALATMLRAGVVRDWDHLKELAEIV